MFVLIDTVKSNLSLYKYLFFIYTGEDIYINLYGAAQDALVRLDKHSIRIKNTFISMSNQRTVIICNRSNNRHFRWTQYATSQEGRSSKM